MRGREVPVADNGGEKISRDAIERTAQDLRNHAQQTGKKDPGWDKAHKQVRDAVLRHEQRNQRKER